MRPQFIPILCALSLAAVPATAIADHGAPAGDPAEIRPERPDRGLIYDGLKQAAPGSACAGLLKVAGEPETCTHGPDPGPRGVDVDGRVSTAALRERATDEVAAAADEGETAGEASIGCTGTGSDGNRVEAIYAHPAGTANRYAALSSAITAWAAHASGVVDASAAQTGGSRRIRFVTESGAAGCQLVIRNLTLSTASASSFGRTVSDLRAQGYDRPDRKYLVWMDASAYCGIAQVREDDSAGPANAHDGHASVPGMVGRVDTGCWGRTRSTEVHELIHTLGGVQLSAPNSSGGYHCTDEYDLECYSDSPNYPAMRFLCPSTEAGLLDCRDDDYFSTAPAAGSYLATHWNTASSSFLSSPEPPLPPSNDDFGAARVLSGSNASRPFDANIGATEQVGEPEHAGNAGGASVWYRWTAGSSDPVTVSTAGSSINTLLAVYTGNSLDGLTLIAANDDANSAAGLLTSSVTFNPVAGQTYAIAVDGFSQLLPQAGLVSLSLAQGQPQSDAPPGASPLTTSGGGTDQAAGKRCAKPKKKKAKKRKRKRKRKRC